MYADISQLPAWVTAGNFDNATLISIMENHIKNLAGRYGKTCTYWYVMPYTQTIILMC